MEKRVTFQGWLLPLCLIAPQVFVSAVFFFYPAGQAIWQAWIDGLEDPQNGGSTVGYSEAPFAETRVVHGGGQSMPLQYDNTTGPGYSEADHTFSPAEDWTVEGVTTLVVHFRGAAGNTGQVILFLLRRPMP